MALFPLKTFYIILKIKIEKKYVSWQKKIIKELLTNIKRQRLSYFKYREFFHYLDPELIKAIMSYGVPSMKLKSDFSNAT